MYSPRLEITKDPLIGKGWKLPRQFRGTTLGDSIPPSVEIWMNMVVAGKVIKASGPFAGSGITVVASDLADEEWITALISDVVRRDPSVLSSQDVMMTTLSDMHDAIREDRSNRATYHNPKILIVSSVTIENQWALNTFAAIFESRHRRSLPTMALVNPMSWELLGSIRTPSPSLTKSLPHRNIVVEI